jgi:hypothetical protein
MLIENPAAVPASQKDIKMKSWRPLSSLWMVMMPWKVTDDDKQGQGWAEWWLPCMCGLYHLCCNAPL